MLDRAAIDSHNHLIAVLRETALQTPNVDGAAAQMPLVIHHELAGSSLFANRKAPLLAIFGIHVDHPRFGHPAAPAFLFRFSSGTLSSYRKNTRQVKKKGKKMGKKRKKVSKEQTVCSLLTFFLFFP
ncbi:hypothetical protein ACWEO2_39815, partial [Nocardia sp. NPDC004278]